MDCNTKIEERIRKEYIDCACHSHILVASFDKEDFDFGLDMSFYTYGNSPIKSGFFRRLMLGLKYIFTGNIFNDQVTLQREDAIMLKNITEEYIKYSEELSKKYE